MEKYIAECMCTFALVFCGIGAIIIDQTANGAVSHVGVAITFGLIVMAMIYAVGEISGAHLNPAATIAFAVNQDIAWKEVLPYICAQICGALLASFILKSLFPTSKLAKCSFAAIRQFAERWLGVSLCDSLYFLGDFFGVTFFI